MVSLLDLGLNLSILGDGRGAVSTAKPQVCSPVHYVEDGRCLAALVIGLCGVTGHAAGCCTLGVFRTPIPGDIAEMSRAGVFNYPHVVRDSSGSKLEGKWHWPEGTV